MVKYCAINGCISSNYKNQEHTFYQFPADEQRCKEWIKAAGRPALEEKDVITLHKSYYVCDLHFDPSDKLKRKLKCGAVPKLNLNAVDSDTDCITNDNNQLDKSTQTDPVDPEDEETDDCEE